VMCDIVSTLHETLECGKLLALLQAYALVASGVRIICSHQAGKAARSTVIQTQAGWLLRTSTRPT